MATTHKATTYLIVTALGKRTREDKILNHKVGDTVQIYMGRCGDPRGYLDMPVWTEWAPEHFPADSDPAELRNQTMCGGAFGIIMIPGTIEVRQIHEFTMTIRDETVVG